VAEREKGADGDGPLARGDEAARGEVDGRDVVRVEGVPEAEGAVLWFLVSFGSLLPTWVSCAVWGGGGGGGKG
jgi:hypothetical protein